MRTGRILELVAKSTVIATTPEHPFHPRDKGWTEASNLHYGDEIRTKDGWVTIEEIRDTGLYETVYNVRVADFHTYFVGGEGCAVWRIMPFAWRLTGRTAIGDRTTQYLAMTCLAKHKTRRTRQILRMIRTRPR